MIDEAPHAGHRKRIARDIVFEIDLCSTLKFENLMAEVSGSVES